MRGNLSTLVDPASGVLPSWAVRSLRQNGYAIGSYERASSPVGANTSIVAWRVPNHEVYYYTDYWGDLQSFQPYAPFSRLIQIGLWGVALIVVLGLLGAWILSRSVVRPVRRLAEASGRLAEGEAGVTVTPQGPRELRELAVSFNDMNAKLAKAQETEQAFLLSVSHELKTPLTSIRGYAEGIGDGTVKPDDGAAVIGAESSRLERLVGDLLESGRMRKSAFTVRREDVDLAAVAEDVVRRYEATARDAGLTLLLQTEAGGRVTADHDRVLQVVSNLVENAIRCTPAPGTVTITTAPDAITVSDTGPRPDERRPAARVRALLPLQPVRHGQAGGHRPRPGHRQGAHRGDGRVGRACRAPWASGPRSRSRCRRRRRDAAPTRPPAPTKRP